MPFMTGNVVSKWLRQILSNLELDFVFFTPKAVETGTGHRIVSGFDCSVSHSKVWDASFKKKMSVKLIKYHLLFLRQYMLHTELTY